MPGNYSFKEYLLLISIADSLEDLSLIDEHLQQDKEAGIIKPDQYIEITASRLLKLTDITIAEMKKKLED